MYLQLDPPALQFVAVIPNTSNEFVSIVSVISL